jgi:Fungal specific transcription factor domain
MKCDTDPVACQPCRSKSLRCYTTDRVTGHPRERGQTDRAESEVAFLRDQLLAYQGKYGPLQPDDVPTAPSRSEPEALVPSVSRTYVGWPAPDNVEPLHTGPINGTKVDLLDGEIDVCDFSCELMENPPRSQLDVFNLSRLALINTIFGFQNVRDPQLPSKEDAIRDVDQFLIVMSSYVPVVHRPTMKDQVARLYDQPESISLPVRVQIFTILGIFAYQAALRNHVTWAENIAKSHRLIHSALGYYRDIYHDTSLGAMQALALLLVHFRNMPKPGVTWSFSNQVLVRLMELQYHRDPDKITLPPGERTVLAKELRKRVFHCVLTICVTTGCRVGLPSPYQFSHLDVPLPIALCDNEISSEGIQADRSGSCEFYSSIHLSRLLPLMTELYNNIISVRRAPADYLKTVDALNSKIVAWKQHWDDSIKHEAPNAHLAVATLLMEQWAAEFQISLHHPSCCTSPSAEVMDRHLDICHKASRRLLQAFHTLSGKFKAVDYTWHSISPYAMGFGITLYVYRRRKGPVTRDQYQTMINELNGWQSLMAYIDVVLKTNNHLQRTFQPRRQALEEEYRNLIIDPLPAVSTSQSPFQAIDGPEPNQQRIAEIALQPTTSMNPPPSYDPTHRSSSMSTASSSSGPAYPAPQRSISASHWNPPSAAESTPQYTPTSMSNSYSSYAQRASMSASGSQANRYPQHQLPVSLAPIPNNTEGEYVSFPQSRSQSYTATAGPMLDYSQMAFNQAHYYHDSSGPYSWPITAMPPEPQ